MLMRLLCLVVLACPELNSALQCALQCALASTTLALSGQMSSKATALQRGNMEFVFLCATGKRGCFLMFPALGPLGLAFCLALTTLKLGPQLGQVLVAKEVAGACTQLLRGAADSKTGTLGRHRELVMLGVHAVHVTTHPIDPGLWPPEVLRPLPVSPGPVRN